MRARWRFVAGVLIGIASWMVGFLALGILLAQLWPEYAVHGRAWMREGVFTFTPAMAACNLLFWAIADVLAGWLAALIAGSVRAAWTVALLLTGYLALMHFVLNWDLFPWWYNLGVVVPAFPATLLGGRLARRVATVPENSAR